MHRARALTLAGASNNNNKHMHNLKRLIFRASHSKGDLDLIYDIN